MQRSKNNLWESVLPSAVWILTTKLSLTFYFHVLFPLSAFSHPPFFLPCFGQTVFAWNSLVLASKLSAQFLSLMLTFFSSQNLNFLSFPLLNMKALIECLISSSTQKSRILVSSCLTPLSVLRTVCSDTRSLCGKLSGCSCRVAIIFFLPVFSCCF